MKSPHADFSIHLMQFLALIWAGSMLSCPQPAQEIVPSASGSLTYYFDPYIVQGKPFRLCLVLDVENGALGAYDITITYDIAKAEILVDNHDTWRNFLFES